MNSLVAKVAELLPFLEDRGLVYLFACAERVDLDRWDVVLCSEWSDEGMAMATFVVAKELTIRLGQEMTTLSRVAIVHSTDPNIQEALSTFDGVQPGDGKVIYGSFLGSDVRLAYVFKVRRPPATLSSKSLASITTM